MGRSNNSKEPLLIVYRPIDDLIPYARNARTHSPEQVAQIAASIREFGFTNPILIDEEGSVIAGHGRILPARQLQLAELPTITLAGLTKAQRRAYIIADNKLALNAGWDLEMLKVEFEDLKMEGFDLSVTGFGAMELEAVTAQEPADGLTDDDAVPEVPVEPVTQTGDIWLLGNHRVMCGDSTLADDVARLMDENAVQLMVTDPPYGVNYDANWRQEAADAGHLSYGAARFGKVTNDDVSSWVEAYRLFTGDVCYVWHASASASAIQFALDLRECGFEIRNQIIWAKPGFAISRGHYNWQHEPCWYAVRKGKRSGWIGDNSQSTLWEISNRIAEHSDHSTEKPVECMARPILNHSGNVYDPFLGSGTTVIAAEKLNRTCYGMEIDPHYCDVIVKRWEDFTGKKATLWGTNETFAEVKQSRLPNAA